MTELTEPPELPELLVHEEQTRVAAAEAASALRTVTGLPAPAAVSRLRYGPGRTCEPVARVLDRALGKAGQSGLSPGRLVVSGGGARRGEDIVRVRRTAHGKADWITSETADIEIRLEPAGLRATAEVRARPSGSRADDGRERATEPPTDTGTAVPPRVEPPGDRGALMVRDLLYEVLDPDLGVNILDLGFVRSITVDHDVATITMTLTSAACPLTGVMEDQIRAVLADRHRTGVAAHRIAWVWRPAWSPADITDEGRDQLRAIGFSF